MERRFLSAKSQPIQLQKRGDDKPPLIVGYAAVFFRANDPGTQYQIWDDFVERVMAGCFDRALKEDDCRALMNHDANLVLGRTSASTCRLSIDGTGLRYEIDPPDTQAGRDLLTSLERGDISGSSFTFEPDVTNWRQEGDMVIRQLESVRLFDVGPVTFPAYESTSAGLRAIGDGQEARKALDDHRAEQRRAKADALAGILAGYRAKAVEVDLEF